MINNVDELVKGWMYIQYKALYVCGMATLGKQMYLSGRSYVTECMRKYLITDCMKRWMTDKREE
jgi:hypothetical protein